jgi:hypothetical protein
MVMIMNAAASVNKWGLTATLALLAVRPAAAATAVFSMRLSDAAGLVLLLLATVSSVLAAKGGTRWWLVVSGVAVLWTGIVVLQIAVGE